MSARPVITRAARLERTIVALITAVCIVAVGAMFGVSL